jgi:hypothetical protein
MMRRNLLGLLPLGALLLIAAGILATVLIGRGVTVTAAPPDPERTARAHLKKVFQERGIPSDGSDLRLDRIEHSLGATHAGFQQLYNGIPVYGASVLVNMDKQASAVSGWVSRYTSGARERSIPQGPAAGEISRLTQSEAIAAAEAAIGMEGEARGTESANLVYYPEGVILILAWQVQIPTLQPLGDWVVLVDAHTGEILKKGNTLRTDSGYVFDPNPPVASAGVVPPPYDCDSAGNAASLSPYRTNETLLGIQPAQNQLKGAYVDLTAPGIVGGYKAAGQASSPTHTYNYQCNQDAFEEVMVYYQIDTAQRKLQSLGFTGNSSVLNEAVPAHAHYMAGCNAFYSSFDSGLHFGDSDYTSSPGLDDCPPSAWHPDTAEDADIMVHEYGHAVQGAQVPGWGLWGNDPNTEQAWSMGEGFADFLSAALSGTTCIGEWWSPGLGLGSCLRDLENSLHFPEDFEACPDNDYGGDEEHCSGPIWGGALWDIVQAFGGSQAARDKALRLVVDSHFYLAPDATYAEGAAAIIQADQDLYGGADVATIQTVFLNRGITAGTLDGGPTIRIYFGHECPWDLDMQIQVGNPPVCTINLTNQGTLDCIPSYFYVTVSGCTGYLPPTVPRPWRLEVKDTYAGDLGEVYDYYLDSGGKRYLASNLPLTIPDNGGFVYSTIDGTQFMQPQPTPAGGQVCGDADSGGTAAMVDAMKVAQCVVGLIDCGTLDPWAADVNCSNTKSMVDAMQIAQKVVGLIPSLSCCG